MLGAKMGVYGCVRKPGFFGIIWLIACPFGALSGEGGADLGETATPDAGAPDGELPASALDRALEEIETAAGEPGATGLDAALEAAPASPPARSDLLSQPLGPVHLRLMDLSADLLVAAGGSTARDEEILGLQGGGHDPRQRGFTLQNLELSLMGAVDPFFSFQTHIIYFIDPEGESKVELEEAFLTTMQLPFGLHERGLEIEAGHFLTEFGRINPRHPHQWEWLDAPVIQSRLFGPDGLRVPGFRIGWLLGWLPWFSELHLGMQSARGETAASFLASDEFFEERPIGGRPFSERDVRGLDDFIYLARLDNSWDLAETVTTKLGGSFLHGPNATGPDGYTMIYGADFFLRWRPLDSDHGWPFVSWQTELMYRDYRADDLLDDGDTADPGDDLYVPGGTLEDWGLYSQVLYGFVRNWAVGFRYEYASGSGESIGAIGGRKDDPFRDDRHRFSPLLLWQPTHFSRVRLQYSYDITDHLNDEDAHSVWLGMEVFVGQHPAHTY